MADKNDDMAGYAADGQSPYAHLNRLSMRGWETAYVW
jgi:hypothetical protein